MDGKDPIIAAEGDRDWVGMLLNDTTAESPVVSKTPTKRRTTTRRKLAAAATSQASDGSDKSRSDMSEVSNTTRAAPGTPEHSPMMPEMSAPDSPGHGQAGENDCNAPLLDDMLIPLEDGDLDLSNNFALVDELFALDGTGTDNSENADGEGEEETDVKKQARLIRNRVSAQLSRQRKKQYVDELEKRCRSLQMTNSELHNLVARLTAENSGLRTHFAMVTQQPLPPGTAVPPMPPGAMAGCLPGAFPGAPMMFQPKLPLPPMPSMMPPKASMKSHPKTEQKAAAAPKAEPASPTAAKADSTEDTTPAVKREVPAASVAAPDAAPSPKKARKAASGVAGTTAGLLTVLSVCLLVSSGPGAITTPSVGGLVPATHHGLGLPATGGRHLTALEGSFGTHEVQLSAPTADDLATAAEFAPIAVAEETQTQKNEIKSVQPAVHQRVREHLAAASSAALNNAPIALRGKVNSNADNEDSENTDTGVVAYTGSAAAATTAADPTAPTKPGTEGTDPWYAAFRAAGMSKFDLLTRVMCTEMFRFTAEDAAKMGAADDLTQRLRDAAEVDDESQVTAGSLGGRFALPDAAAAAAKEEVKAGAGVSEAGRDENTSVLPIGAGLGEDNSLVSVLLPPAPSTMGAKGAGAGIPSLSKLFVVTYSRRSSDYVTYSCRLPTATNMGGANTRKARV